jgi:hypothetical protein
VNFSSGPRRKSTLLPLHAFGRHVAHLAQHVVPVGLLNDAFDAPPLGRKVASMGPWRLPTTGMAPSGFAAHFLQELEAIHLRHHQVEDDRVRLAFNQRQRIRPSPPPSPSALFGRRPHLSRSRSSSSTIKTAARGTSHRVQHRLAFGDQPA